MRYHDIMLTALVVLISFHSFPALRTTLRRIRRRLSR